MATSNNTKSSSQPLTAAQRRKLYSGALNSMGETMGWQKLPENQVTAQRKRNDWGENDTRALKYQMPSFQYDAPGYSAASYTALSSAERFSGGDYNRLESNIANSSLAPLARQESVWRNKVDENLSKRGIYSSGAAVQAQNDITERLAPVYSQAGSQAATQRYGLQANEMAQMNNRSLQDASMKNTYGMQEASRKTAFDTEQSARKYQAKWRPLDYLQGVWNGTGGVITGSNSSSFGVG